jgi:hypothetical protein
MGLEKKVPNNFVMAKKLLPLEPLISLRKTLFQQPASVEGKWSSRFLPQGQGHPAPAYCVRFLPAGTQEESCP